MFGNPEPVGHETGRQSESVKAYAAFFLSFFMSSRRRRDWNLGFEVSGRRPAQTLKRRP